MSGTNSTYTKTPVGNGVKFAVIPVPSPAERFSFSRTFLAAFPAYFAAGAVSIVVMPMAAVDFALIRFIALALLAAAFVFAWFKSYRWISAWIVKKQTTLRHAYPVEFLVNGDMLEVPGTKTTIRSADIHRLVLKNAYDNAVELPYTSTVAAGALTVGVAAASGALTNAVAAVANHKLKEAARVSYQVSVEAGGVAHVIAGGLTEICAHGLMTDIGRVLDA